MYQAKVIADSIAQDVRLTTLEVCMPRIILAEFNTHRMLSRNSASSRAIPVEKRIKAIEEHPFIPESFSKNQRGMQAGEALAPQDLIRANNIWEGALIAATTYAEALAKLGVHKQWANRLLEPFSWTTVVVTATEWDNFFALRISLMAQPEIRRVAELMKEAMDSSIPQQKLVGEWHLPYTRPEDFEGPLEQVVKLSCARCARVSYLTQDGKRDPKADIDLYNRLASAGHMSPLEHAAKVVAVYTKEGEDEPRTQNGIFRGFCGNFRLPWIQHRKQIPNEDVFRGE